MDAVAVPEAVAHLRRFALDGAMLLFDRDTGLNVRPPCGWWITSIPSG